jgi:N-hydroxyarylamine O-acetyltransferase
MDFVAYLKRIRYSGPTDTNSETLRRIHRAHLLAVPFENLDIPLKRAIACDESSFVRKIVEQRRGGFCYEMNGAFAALLRALGFKVTLLSARVPRADGSPGPEFDHLTLRVDLDQPWLADVGFGDSFIEPLRLKSGVEQEQYGRKYRIIESDAALELQVLEPGGDWKQEYTFTLQPRQLSDFAGMCHYHQTSPESPFTHKKLCSIATEDGRVTVSDMKLMSHAMAVKRNRLSSRNRTGANY